VVLISLIFTFWTTVLIMVCPTDHKLHSLFWGNIRNAELETSRLAPWLKALTIPNELITNYHAVSPLYVSCNYKHHIFREAKVGRSVKLNIHILLVRRGCAARYFNAPNTSYVRYLERERESFNFYVCSDRLWGPPSLPSGARVFFPGGKVAEAWSWPLTSI
jgi:hypothetical protein